MKQEHPLDNLIWDSIIQNHKHLAKTSENAAVYDPQVFNFAGLKENTNKAWTELAELVAPNRIITIAIEPPESQTHWEILHQLYVNQMIIEKPIPHKEIDFETLTTDDVPQMIELMEITGASPFTERTIDMGGYIGHKIDGKLVAMGGERMKVNEFVEISGIGTHPDYRNRGLGKAITGTLTNDIFERGEIPFLHCWDGNEPAFSLYKKLGFITRIRAPAYVIRRKP
jgi:predicted GNAT family acetyltransferase